MPDVDLVIFDCDGVLVDSEIIHNRNMAGYLTELGMPHTADDCLTQYAGRSMASVISLIENNWGPLPDTFATELRRRNFETSKTQLRAIDGVASVLETIPFNRCVASSGHPTRIRQSLEITDLLESFEPHIFSAVEVKNGKPAPDLFLHAAERMDASPERTVVIEDSIFGVQGAVAADMAVFGFTGGSHVTAAQGEKLRAEGAACIFDAMADLPNLLQSAAEDRL